MREGSAVVDPVRLTIEPQNGALGGRTGIKRTLWRDLTGIYADTTAFQRISAERGEDVAYEVQEFRPDRVAPQELVLGTSTLQPGTIGAEFSMTRGHIHKRPDRPEVYVCQRGRGVMHMEAPDGETRPVEMAPGSIVYVPAYWVHRSVNVGTEPLVTLFCYPADAGQDYGIIERSRGMRTLIVEANGGWAERENRHYRQRSPEEQRCYLDGAAGQ